MDGHTLKKNDIRIGTIGTSMITDRVMGQFLEYKDYKYEAIYTRKERNARALKKKYGVKKVYTQLDDMLHDHDIDCIYIASPNSLHFQQAKDCILAGKDVILEKPFCTNVEETKELIKLAKQEKVFLFEAITTIYNPNYRKIKQELNSLGKIKIVECNLSKYSSKYDEFLKGKKPNIFTTEYSGGALMDINVYNIHFVVGLFGMPSQVSYFPNYSGDIDTSGLIIMDYNDFKVSCIGSKDNDGFSFCQIQGEKGSVFVEGLSSRVKNVLINNRKGMKAYTQERTFSHYYYAGEMLDMMKNGNYDRCYSLLEHTLNVMKVIDQAKESASLWFFNDKKCCD